MTQPVKKQSGPVSATSKQWLESPFAKDALKALDFKKEPNIKKNQRILEATASFIILLFGYATRRSRFTSSSYPRFFLLVVYIVQRAPNMPVSPISGLV